MSEAAPRSARKRLPPDERRAQLLAIAIDVFAERGLGAARHAEIAERAGVAVSTVFVYFPTREEVQYFHTPEYVDFVRQASADGYGSLDGGDTPAYPGVFDAASYVVGGTLVALEAIMTGPIRRAFIPIGGLHHAARGRAAG